MASVVAAPPLTLLLIRLISSALVLLSTISLALAFARPSSESTTPVVRIPRRALILLSFSAITHLLDGFIFVFYAKTNTGIDINAVIGFVTFSGLAILGAWNNVSHDVEVKKVKASLAISLVLDIAQIILIGLPIHLLRECKHLKMMFSASLPDDFTIIAPPIKSPDNHHFTLLCFRILFLVPLLASLLSLRVVSTSIRNGDSLKTPGLDALAGDTSNPTGMTTSSKDEGPTVAINICVHFSTFNLPVFIQDEKRDMPRRHLFQRIRRMTPFIWPSKRPSLQFLAVSL